MVGWFKGLMFAGMPQAPVKKHCPFCKREVMTNEPRVKQSPFDTTIFYHPCPMQEMRLVVLTTKSKRDRFDSMAF